MNHISSQNTVPWKVYISTLIECTLSFGIATFCMAMFFTHQGSEWVFLSILLGILYLFVIVVCVRRIAQRFSFATLMLFIPIAPLIPLVIILMLIPILQALH
jgi:hypothetical protein